MARVFDVWLMYKELVLDALSVRERMSEEGRWAQHLAPDFAEAECADVTSLRVMRFRRSLERKGLSPQSVHHCLSLLRRLLLKAQRLDLYNGRLPHFDMPRFDNKRQRFLSPEEAGRLLALLRGSSPLWYDISLFALQTGLRAGEIFQLTGKQVCFHSQTVSIFDSKNNSTRHVPLNATAREVLARNLPPEPENLFFTNKGARIIQAGSAFRNAVSKSGVNKGVHDRRSKVVFHTFRHTFASWLIQAGTPLLVVSTLLGHKSIAMTQRYAHLAPDQTRQAVHGLPDLGGVSGMAS